MESLAIAIGIIGGLVAAPIFCFMLVKLITPHPRLSRVAFYLSLVALGLFLAELLLVATRGALIARELVGPSFFPVHALITLGSAPALACALVLGRRNFARWWPAVAAICWLVGVFSIFYQYGVAETLYGIDSQGGPYSAL
jgi:hypothetical protein